MSNPVPGFGASPEPQRAAGAPPQPPVKKSKTWIIVLVVVGVVILGFIGACSVIVGAMNAAVNSLEEPNQPVSAVPVTPGSEGSGPAEGPVEGEPTTDPEPTEEPTEDAVLKIGDVATYENGLKVQVTKAVMVEPKNEYADTAEDGKYLKVTIKITNGTKKNYDPGLASTSVSYGEDGDQADTTYDDGTDFSFEGKIAPGKSKSATFAYVVTAKQAKDLQISFQPDWDSTEVVFLGSAK